MPDAEREVFILARVHLTSREMETLILLAEGLGNKQVARRLGISEHGSKRLVMSIMTKLDTRNRTGAVVKAIRLGLIKVDEE